MTETAERGDAHARALRFRLGWSARGSALAVPSPVLSVLSVLSAPLLCPIASQSASTPGSTRRRSTERSGASRWWTRRASCSTAETAPPLHPREQYQAGRERGRGRAAPPDLTVTTSVYAAGPVGGGVLRGDLVLYGRGDPTFGERCYASDTLGGRCVREGPVRPARRAGRRTQARGVGQVQGDLVGDGS